MNRGYSMTGAGPLIEVLSMKCTRRGNIVLSLYVTYVVVFTAAGVACLAGLLGVRSLDHPDVRRGLGGLLVTSGAWSLFTAGQFLTTSIATKRIVYTGALIVGISTVFAWLYFASAYSGRQYHRDRTYRLVGAAILGSVVVIKLTNPLHGAYFHAEIATEPFRHARIDHFAVHWFVTGFAYTAAGVGFWWLFESFSEADSQPLHLYALVTATAVPIVPYAISYYTDGYLLYVNYEPLGVAVFALGVFFYARTEFTRLSSPDRSYIADSISEGVVIVDEGGYVINYNDSAAAVVADLSQRTTPLETVDDELAALEDGETVVLERTVDGRERQFEAERTALPDAPMAASAITLTDVSRVAHLEELTRLYQEISEALVENTGPETLREKVAETIADIESYRIVWLYPGDDTGYVGGEPSGYVEGRLANTDRREPVLEAAETGEQCRLEVREGDGGWATEAAGLGITECLAVPLESPDGGTEVLGIYTTASAGFSSAEAELFVEIGGMLSHAIAAIRAHEESTEYREAISHAGYAVYITDVDGTIRHVNPAFEEITGYSAEEAVGRTPEILNSGEMDEAYYDRLWGTILAGEVFEEEIVNKTRDGDRYLARQTVAPVTDEGEPVAFVAIQADITDRHVREQRLTVLNRVLRHNLRNEMTLVSGNARRAEDALESLPSSVEREAVAEPVETIRAVADEIAARSEKAREVENVLDRTGISGDPDTVEEVVDRARRVLEGADVDGSVRLADEVATWQVDGELTRVVEELLENAIRHNDEPSPVVDLEADATDDGEVRFSVVDNGPGLTEQELTVLDDEEETQLRHGSGLGLWMVNWLVVNCGGSVGVDPESDGTRIDVVVPPRQAERPAKPT